MESETGGMTQKVKLLPHMLRACIRVSRAQGEMRTQAGNLSCWGGTNTRQSLGLTGQPVQSNRWIPGQ